MLLHFCFDGPLRHRCSLSYGKRACRQQRIPKTYVVYIPPNTRQTRQKKTASKLPTLHMLWSELTVRSANKVGARSGMSVFCRHDPPKRQAFPIARHSHIPFFVCATCLYASCREVRVKETIFRYVALFVHSHKFERGVSPQTATRPTPRRRKGAGASYVALLYPRTASHTRKDGKAAENTQRGEAKTTKETAAGAPCGGENVHTCTRHLHLGVKKEHERARRGAKTTSKHRRRRTGPRGHLTGDREGFGTPSELRMDESKSYPRSAIKNLEK